MTKARDLADLIAAGSVLADGTVEAADISDVTATAAELNLLDGVTATTAELNYVDGVTSAIQTQIDTKAPTASPTFTGTITFPAGQTFDGRDVSADGTKLDGIEASADVTDTTNVSAAGALMKSGGTMTGAITFAAGQTFDGRDVSADGSKLDGIESGATADQTKADIDGLGINAATLDSLDSTQFLRSDATDTFTTISGTEVSVSTAVATNVYVADNIYHSGDEDTRILFGTNTITMQTGGSSEITVDTTGVRLGDSGNGYFQPVTGNYGSIQIDGGAHGGYEGYSIGGRVVFMHENNNAAGIYNDLDNQWMFLGTLGGSTVMHHAGSAKIETTSGGVNINGDINAVDNVFVAGNVYHEGDTDTYVGFFTNEINLYAGNTGVSVQPNGIFLFDGSLREDYDALSGTSPTCNVNSGGAFSLSMSGNTTFTFTSPTSGYSTGFVLQLTGNGGTVTWPASVDWAGGTAPDAPASGETDLLVFWTRDGGTTWYGALAIDAAA